MTAPLISVGIIGAGVVTSGSHLPVLVNLPEVRVDWICDRSLTAAKAVARAYGIARTFGEGPAGKTVLREPDRRASQPRHIQSK